ncbi:MAG: hypothetical protein E3J70_05760 [Candidatus Heimdallarchaeota archaeon]|nr:MAG: hypothetical protein E3J70_05760 [Candidatus Heimdallarchaeota archaeon]
MLELKKTEEWAFFFLFIGGNLLIANAIIGIVVHYVTGQVEMHLLDGQGLFVFAVQNFAFPLGASLNIIIGILALLCGLKLFINPIRNFISKIDMAIIGIMMFILGAISFSLPGGLLMVAGVYCFLYRLTVQGANNPTAK